MSVFTGSVHILPAVLAVACIFLFYSVNAGIEKRANEKAREAKEAARIEEENTPYVWPDSGLALSLPKPFSETGKITANSETSFIIYVFKTSEAQFNEYVQACKESGYIIEPDSKSGYKAYNNEGCLLYVRYYPDGNSMSIDLDAPRNLGPFEWPKSDLAAQLPVINSTVGEIITDRSDRFAAYFGNVPLDELNTYIDECWEAGFSINHTRSQDYFSAENSGGYELLLQYEGFNTIYLRIDAPEEELPVDDETSSKAEKKSSDAANGETSEVSASLKDLLDSYEDFIDSYIEFMKEYDSSDLSMLTKYMSMMTKYAEFAEKIDALDSENFSSADAAYYLEVTTRVQAKLAAAAVTLP